MLLQHYATPCNYATTTMRLELCYSNYAATTLCYSYNAATTIRVCSICFKENSSLHISTAKAGLQFLNDQKLSIYPAKFPNDLFVTAQTAFHHSTFRFITAHFVHHCTLKQALTTLLYCWTCWFYNNFNRPTLYLS